MIIKTFQYNKNHGWSVDHFPELDSEQTLILVFSSPTYIENPAPFRELADAYPSSIMIGCSSAGEILGPTVSDDSIAVAIVKFKKTKIKTTQYTICNPKDSRLAGIEIAKRLNANDLRSIFIVSDGLHINGSELVKGLNSINNNEVVITGGLAADGNQFKQTFTIQNGNTLTNTIVGVGLYGDSINIGHGSKGGWDIFGPERVITKSRHNILYELDGKPALDIYRNYLGDKANNLPASGLLFPLAIRKDMQDKSDLVRTILGINEKDKSLIFAGDMPTGYLAKLMRANFDRLIAGATDASRLIIENNDRLTEYNSPTLLIAISCVGRRLLLGERTEEETESTLEIFPKGTEQIGFYSYGELSPHCKGRCDLHNQTMTLTSITESV